MSTLKVTDLYDDEQPHIVAAAIRDKATDKIYSLEPPKRHVDICRLINAETKMGFMEIDQKMAKGFLLSDGRWVNRKQAFDVAYYQRQLKENANVVGGELTTDELW